MSRLLLFFINIVLIYPSLCRNATNKSSSINEKILSDRFVQSDYQIDFERAEMVRFNKQYLRKLDVKTFKYNRTTTAVNVTWWYKVDIGNTLEIVAQAYKFASNEYRVFPLRLQMNFCEAVGKNIMGFNGIRCGNFTGCPLSKERTTVCNWFPDQSRFPPFIPNGKYMLELQGLSNSTEMWLMRGYGTIFRPIVKK